MFVLTLLWFGMKLLRGGIEWLEGKSLACVDVLSRGAAGVLLYVSPELL
jgi:hypothetical protein